MNNPLKYTDPSGHKVQIGNSKIYGYQTNGNEHIYQMRGSTENEKKLEFIWKAFTCAAPNIAKMLQKSEETIKIQTSRINSDANCGGLTITIDIDHMNFEVNNLGEAAILTTGLLAHEIVHATTNLFDPNSTNSIYEETTATEYANQIMSILGSTQTWWDNVVDLVHTDLSMQSSTLNNQLFVAWDILSKIDKHYEGLGNLPSTQQTFDTIQYNFSPQWEYYYNHYYVNYFGLW